MFRLTIIIPFFRDTPTTAFEETLASVLAQTPADAEIVVPNNGGYSDPWKTDSDGVVFLSLSHLTNPVDLLNEAIRQSRGEIVHILYPGTEVTECWTESALVLFDSPEVAVVVPRIHDRRKTKRVFSLGIHYRQDGTLRTIRRAQWQEASIRTIVPHVAAVFFRRSFLARIDWLDRSFLPQFAYADAALAIARSEGTIVVDQACRIMVRPNLLPAMRPFSWGIQIERLYFRCHDRCLSFACLKEHLSSLFVDFWRHLPRLSAFQLLSGRCCGLFCFSGIRRSFGTSAETSDSVPFSETVPTLKKTA